MSTNIPIDTNTSPDTSFSDRYARTALSSRLAWLGVAVIVIVIVSVFLWFFAWRAPARFPSDADFAVQKGATLSKIAERLAERDFVRSPLWFKAWSVGLGGQGGLKAGEYYFGAPLSVVGVARRLTSGAQELPLVKITIPEGLSNRKVALILSQALPRFNRERFLLLAAEREGYLFPDTYSFFPNTSEENIIKDMEDNFTRRTAASAEHITAFGRSREEIIIMASLIEGEARTEETRRTVSGILWKRLGAGMPLQVDAVFPYIFGDRPYDLTDGDLLVDSPYNTYKYAGLPPAPISNPGIDAIRAAIMPIETPYWYYLSDREGNMHYAVSHDEHLANRAKYLQR